MGRFAKKENSPKKAMFKTRMVINTMFYSTQNTVSASGVSPLFQAALQDAKQAKPSLNSLKLPIFTTGNIRGSPQKMNHLARLLPGRTLSDAMRQMRFTLKRRGKNVAMLINRIQNALRHNYGIDPAECMIERAWVGKGVYLKRIRLHGRGRFGTMHRPSSHIKVIVGPNLKPKTREEKDLQILSHALRQQERNTKLNVVGIMRENVPIAFTEPIWSKKPWKYVTVKRWRDPDSVLAKHR